MAENTEVIALDKAFIEKIYREYYSLIKLVVINSICSDVPDDITSCVQDVFLAAMKQENLELHVSVKGWLLKTAANLTGNFNRNYLKHARHIDVNCVNYKYCYNKSDGAETSEKEIEASETDFTGALMEKIEMERLKNLDYEKVIMDSLFGKEKEFYELLRNTRLNVKEIGGILHISEGAAAVRRSRLKGKIKKILDNM